MPSSTSAFSANSSLLSRINWGRLGTQVAAELRNREIHAPAVSAYRWWARRPHSVMGALLDVAMERYGDDLTVSDPFSGGGTVTFEAARRGIRAYAQDIYPWPARGLATALQVCQPEALRAAAAGLLAALDHHRTQYRTPEGAELSHVLRVRVSGCKACSCTTHEYPHAMVSLASRGLAERRAFYGCSLCGTVSERAKGIESFRCDGCGRRRPVKARAETCGHCDLPHLQGIGWKAVLVQELVVEKGRLRAALRPVRSGDPVAAEDAAYAGSPLLEPILMGKETKRLIDNGFARWGQLYTKRQATVLLEALDHVRESAHTLALKDRLAFGVLGAAEMPAFLSRWDRVNLKAFEGMANHRYTQTTFAVETNLLSPVGRGTLVRRLASSESTLRWLIESCETPPKVVSVAAGRRGRKRTDWDILVAVGSSAKQELRDGAATVILTDPPYFDDVQYGELARLFHTWLKVYDPGLTYDERQEAVPNAGRGTTSADYERMIAACFAESRRTLRPGGALVLTYHNKHISAWRALAGALHKAGFEVRALAVVQAENGADHCKRSVEAMLHDLVIECMPRTSRPQVPTLEFQPRSVPDRNLAAVGLALAECVNTGRVDELRPLYREQLERYRCGKRLIE